MRLRAAIAACVACTAMAAHGQDEAARLMGELMSGKAAVGGPFALPDADGKLRSLAEFRGKLVLLYFGYLGCPDVCPTDLAQIGQAIRALGPAGEGVQPLFVTVDPDRDTPEALREYVRAFHPRFVGLRGNAEETRRIARSFKVSYGAREDGLVDHPAFTFLLDREGKYVAFFPPGTPAARMAQLLREVADRPDEARAADPRSR